MVEKANTKLDFKTSLNGVDLSFANIKEYERTKHVHR